MSSQIHINYNNFVGKGACSSVYVGHFEANPQKLVAVKVMDKCDRLAAENYRSAVKSLGNSDHPNIVKLYNYFETSDQYFLVLEYLESPCMDLNCYKMKMEGQISQDIVYKILVQLLSVLSYLHGRGIAHRDLKLENIMINPETLHVTLIDFGFACNAQQVTNDVRGSPLYMCPFMLFQKYYIPEKVDLWSLGIVLYELVYGFTPFNDCNNVEELKEKIVTEMILPYRTGSGENLCNALGYSMVNLLQKEQVHRLGAYELLVNYFPEHAIYLVN
eukprot:TRINITY_DN9721_c0_g1_i1.p1 TRINITY_DN9721_c0_g1~~TRINITY_DN9721_c0_g1_i1.p1  ORF type:complete len:293 (-),score=38.80 TRINITY_DN9721_c0_g1_i1:29-850(-)